jgi:hypothetical protein
MAQSKLRAMPGQTLPLPLGGRGTVQPRPVAWRALTSRLPRTLNLCFLICLPWLVSGLAGVTVAVPTSAVVTTSVKNRITDLLMRRS